MPYSPIEVAKWFINKGIEENNPVTQMKLQKMLYFAQGYSLAKFGEPIIDADFEAWQFGPVIPEIYTEFSSYSAFPIDDAKWKIRARFDANAQRTLLTTWMSTKDVSASKLSAWTHLPDSPWDDAYTPRANNIISEDKLKLYFEKRILTKKKNEAEKG